MVSSSAMLPCLIISGSIASTNVCLFESRLLRHRYGDGRRRTTFEKVNLTVGVVRFEFRLRFLADVRKVAPVLQKLLRLKVFAAIVSSALLF